MAEKFETAKAGTSIDNSHPSWDPEGGDDQKISAEASWQPGDNLTEAVEMYGEELVYELYVAHGTRNLSNTIRSLLNSGVKPEDVQERLADWRPDTPLRTTRKPEDNVLANFSKLSAEKQQEILQQLMAQAQAGNGEEAEVETEG